MEKDKLVIHPKHAKGEDGYRIFSIRIKEELVDKINDISAQTGYSRNELIGKFIEYALDHCTVSKNDSLN